MNIWSYSSRKLPHSIETRHTTNILCTKFILETSDEHVASAAEDVEVVLLQRFSFVPSKIGNSNHETKVTCLLRHPPQKVISQP